VEIRTFVADELGNSSYLILLPEEGAAIAVDPARNVEPYLKVAEAAGLRITWALETHVHNDFVSGSRELNAEVGSVIGASGAAGLRYRHEPLSEGARINAGKYQLKVMETPGHTPEHLSFLLADELEKPIALFSGGSLMVGTAARTDLLGIASGWPMALRLRASLRDHLLALPDDVPVLPTHGAGSLCAAGASDRRETTIGTERATNTLALAMSDLEFAGYILDQGPYPSYFEHMRGLNQVGAPLIGRRVVKPKRLTLEEFDDWRARGAAVIDLGRPKAFAKGHIPGSFALGMEGRHSSWVGWLFGPNQPLVLVTDTDDLAGESVAQLAEIGYDQVVGCLQPGLALWTDAGRLTDAFPTISAQGLMRRLLTGEQLVVLDVRERAEWFAGHIPGSVNIPVHELGGRAQTLPSGSRLAIHCGRSFRATLGASILEQLGHRDLLVIEDGYSGWAKAASAALASNASKTA
jgi:hydroxyacylglutathione hydrolase